jgi:hypothetical protein
MLLSMSRLRNELVRIIIAQAAKQKDVATREAFSSSVCDRIIGSIRVRTSVLIPQRLSTGEDLADSSSLAISG